MKRYLIHHHFLLALLLLITTGCAGVGTARLPGGVAGVRTSPRQAQATFVLLTDGQIYSMNATYNIPLGAQWNATIKPANTQLPEIDFRATSRKVIIQKQKFPLQRGQVFIIRTKGNQPQYEQLSLPTEVTTYQQLVEILKTDERFKMQ